MNHVVEGCDVRNLGLVIMAKLLTERPSGCIVHCPSSAITYTKLHLVVVAHHTDAKMLERYWGSKKV